MISNPQHISFIQLTCLKHLHRTRFKNKNLSYNLHQELHLSLLKLINPKK